MLKQTYRSDNNQRSDVFYWRQRKTDIHVFADSLYTLTKNCQKTVVKSQNVKLHQIQYKLQLNDWYTETKWPTYEYYLIYYNQNKQAVHTPLYTPKHQHTSYIGNRQSVVDGISNDKTSNDSRDMWADRRTDRLLAIFHILPGEGKVIIIRSTSRYTTKL